MTETRQLAPVRRSVRVAAPVETAFALFTAHIGAWWPCGQGHSVYGKDAMVAFEGDLLVERHQGESSVWAEVLGWDPPTGFRLNWHPGSDAARATQVDVSFTPEDGGTLVALVHTGWERTAAPVEMRSNYDVGWGYVLGWYDAIVGRSVGSDPDVGHWYALRHTPGPALADGESIFASPAFSEHLGFLERLDQLGLLVAAGPLSDAEGAGMTVVRVLPEHGDVDIYELATSDDRAVAEGYLVVDVRPWAVRFTG